MTLSVELQLLDDLRDQTVDDAVVAAGAVMELLVGQQSWSFQIEQPSYFRLLQCFLSIFSTISSAVGIMAAGSDR